MTDPSKEEYLFTPTLPPDAQLLHEQRGLWIRKNAKNGFHVITLHHTADPKKRSLSWRQEAAQGLTKAKFAREYDIDYDSTLGEKVFPEMVDKRSEIVIPVREFDAYAPFWGGLDFGINNPSSFHVYTVEDGVAYAIWELYEPCRNVKEWCERLKACPYWGKLKYVAADTSIWEHRGFSEKDGNPKKVIDDLLAEGVGQKLIRANKDETTWLLQMQKHWREENITFKIFETCPKMIWEFQTAIFRGMSERAMVDKNYVEEVRDKDNHAMDDCKYWMNSRPSAPKVFDRKRKVAVSGWLRK